MRDDERRALSRLRFSWAPTAEEIWSDPTVHVDGFNDNVMLDVREALTEALDSSGPCPMWIVIAGAHGSGKTHEVRRTRKLVQDEGGYFFVLGLPSSDQNIWQKAVHAFRDGLQRKGSHQQSQLRVFLNRLAEKLDLSDELRRHVTGTEALRPEDLQQVVHALRRQDDYLGRTCQHTLRALLMLGSDDFDLQDLAENYLFLQVEGLTAKLDPWGVVVGTRDPQDVAGEISKLLAFTGPLFIAVDQIDSVFNLLHRQIAEATSKSEAGAYQRQLDALATEIGTGLMEMREHLWRTVTLVSCLNSSWALVKLKSPGSAEDRFREVASTRDIRSAEVAERFVTSWVKHQLAGVDFLPPEPTWPVAPDAFATAKGKTPRELLKCVDQFARVSLKLGQVLWVVDFNASPETKVPTNDADDDDAFRRYDRYFQGLRTKNEDRDPLVDPPDDQELSGLLEMAFTAWIQEQGDRRERFKVLGGKGERPSMHAWLVETLDEEAEVEVHWSLRGIPHKSAISYQSHLRKLQSFADMGHGDARKGFVLRNGEPPSGPVTARMVKEFEALGGRHLDLTAEDVRTMRALSQMIADQAEDSLSPWLASRSHASRMPLFRKIFGDPPDSDPIGPSPSSKDGPNSPVDVEDATDSVCLGYDAETAQAVHFPLLALRKHVAIFAGSGSGKTVLIKRIVEECAIQGVSAIVLDPNNDLARMGDPWPSRPASWREFDDQQASSYFSTAEVVVWTPRRESGRPLSLQPLPDFAAVRSDPDEFGQALDTAVAALAPRARMDRHTAKLDKGRAIMREALAHYTRAGGASLTGYIDFLAELPDSVTTLTKAADIAHEISQTLTAAMINDPLFGGAGIPMDPGILLTPSPGKKARISVISMIGLPTNEQRQSFVNQLQMGLFAWIKRHPAGARPLSGLLVMDEAQTLAPSGAMTACTESTLALASQARKYGLGLVFATQAPRGIHNRIIGNAATQFYGFLNSQVQIQAAKELAQAKSSEVLDISRLSAGQFYAVGEGMPFHKVRTPLCLSHHPESALTPEEVLERARA